VLKFVTSCEERFCVRVSTHRASCCLISTFYFEKVAHVVQCLGYELRPENVSTIPRAKCFCLHSVQNATGRHEDLFPKFVLSSWVKHPFREADSSVPPSTEGNDAWSFT